MTHDNSASDPSTSGGFGTSIKMSFDQHKGPTPVNRIYLSDSEGAIIHITSFSSVRI
jgi:hypothetical protein